jgi:transposase
MLTPGGTGVSAKKWRVVLTEADRAALVAATRRGLACARDIRRAHILLQAAEGRTDEQIAAALHTNRSTVERTRRRCVQEGIDRAVRDRPRPGAPRKLDGKQEAFLVALACSNPPEGQVRWSMRLLADRLVSIGAVDTISGETVRRVLKRGGLKPWLKEQWCIPKVGAEFVWRMEDVLDLYAEPYDPQHPVVCFDERPCQLLADVRPPEAAQPGRPARVDYEYRRNGTFNVFTVFQPLAGWRHVEVTTRRACADFAEQMRRLVDEHFPSAETIRVVLDNLSTHTPAAVYETFAPEMARRLTRKLEFHHTPKHGSWLNMVEIELSILARQCLDRRLPDLATVRREVAAWALLRNQAHATVDWRFRTTDARTKLRRLYPV